MVSVKKIAIFVEGHTELAFVEKFLLEIGNSNQLSIRKEELQGGGKSPLIIRFVGEKPVTGETKYQILLRSSCNDEKVLADIKEHYAELMQNGFEKVIGIRDLYRKDKDNYPRQNNVKSAMKQFIEQNHLQNAHMVLAVMEIETWFIAETTHFSKIHSNLTAQTILPIIDLGKISNFEGEIQHPADTLNQIYHLVGFAYQKKGKQVQRTINALDYAEMYLKLRKKLPNLDDFVSHLDSLFDIQENVEE
jgi:hypothetical protein